MSNSVLSLLVALVSVSAIAGPAIISAFRSQRSDIRVTVIRSREHETVKNYLPDRKFDFQLYVANVGNCRGAIGRVQMRPKTGGTDSWEDLDFTPHYAETMDELIEPGTATFLYYSRASLFSHGAFQDRPLPKEVELRVEVISEDARRNYVEIKIATGGKQGKQDGSVEGSGDDSHADSQAIIRSGQSNGVEGYWEQRFYQNGAWQIGGVSLISRDENGQLTMKLVDSPTGLQGSTRIFDMKLDGNQLSFKSDWGRYGIGTFRLERECADRYVGASYNEDGSQFAKNEFCRVEYKSTPNTIASDDSGRQKEVSKREAQTDQHVSRYDDPKVKAAHDTAGMLVTRLRTIGPQAQLDAERERHLFNMIRISEYAWAGRLKDLDAANADIERAEEFCKKHGV